jgi:hypothetical protein
VRQMENYGSRGFEKRNNYRNSYYENNFNKNKANMGRSQEAEDMYNKGGYDGNTINAESLNIDTTLNDISKELKPGETLILDIGNNYFHQTDEIYDTLIMRGYEVRKSFKNGRNQIVVSMKA